MGQQADMNAPLIKSLPACQTSPSREASSLLALSCLVVAPTSYHPRARALLDRDLDLKSRGWGLCRRSLAVGGMHCVWERNWGKRDLTRLRALIPRASRGGFARTTWDSGGNVALSTGPGGGKTSRRPRVLVGVPSCCACALAGEGWHPARRSECSD
jgi:hypothetical protein